MQVLINKCYGGFGLSDDAIRRLFELKGWKCIEEKRDDTNTFFYKDVKSDESFFWETNLERNDPEMVQVVKEMGDKANGRFAELKIVDIPDDVRWYVEEYDGMESVHEEHRSWE